MKSVIEMWKQFLNLINVKKLVPDAKEAGRRDMTILLEAYREGGAEVLAEFGGETVTAFAGEPKKLESKPKRKARGK